MRTTKLTALVAGYVSLALGDEPAQLPPLKKRAVALGYSGSIVHLDVLRNGDSELEPSGLGVLGRVDVHGGWGLQFGYSRKDDGIGGGGEIFLAQSGLYAYYAWEGRWSDTERIRFYPKAGVAYMDFEETVPMTGTLSIRRHLLDALLSPCRHAGRVPRGSAPSGQEHAGAGPAHGALGSTLPHARLRRTCRARPPSLRAP